MYFIYVYIYIYSVIDLNEFIKINNTFLKKHSYPPTPVNLRT